MTTDTSLLAKSKEEDTLEVKRTYEDDTDDVESQPDTSFYTEKTTRLIYEVQFFQDFALARPASPAFRSALRQLNFKEFTEEFEEFAGDPQIIRDLLNGEDSLLESSNARNK